MTEPTRPLYRRLAEVGDDVTSVVPLIIELQELLQAGNSSTKRSPEDGYWSADDCLQKLASRDRQSTIAMAYWFADDALVDCGKRLFELRAVGDLRKGSAWEVVDISGLESPMVVRCACRLSALATSPTQSLAWALALAARATGPEDPVHGVAVGLLRYHAEEFPLTTLRLLSDRPAEYRDLALAKGAAEYLRQQDEALDAFERLPEFAMSLPMRIALAEQKRRVSRQIERSRKGGSLLESIFKQQHLKYANTTAVEVRLGDQVKEQALTMAPYSVSFELPLSEALDPQSGQRRRARLWEGQAE
jgi:hypothetical protein